MFPFACVKTAIVLKHADVQVDLQSYAVCGGRLRSQALQRFFIWKI
jgi:hypothetical protein